MAKGGVCGKGGPAWQSRGMHGEGEGVHGEGGYAGKGGHAW